MARGMPQRLRVLAGPAEDPSKVQSIHTRLLTKGFSSNESDAPLTSVAHMHARHAHTHIYTHEHMHTQGDKERRRVGRKIKD